MINKTFDRIALCAFLLAVIAPADGYAGIIITDGFEAPTLSPNWVLSGSGSASPTTAAAFDGTRSLELQLASVGVNLTQNLGSNLSGSVSIYMQRPACCSASAADLEIWNQGVVEADIQENGDGSYGARVLPNGVNVGTSFSNGDPNGWHQLEIDTDSTGITLKFDGTTVLTSGLVTSFDAANLSLWAGANAIAYYDDFTADVGPASPEPSDMWYGCAALAMVIVWRWANPAIFNQLELTAPTMVGLFAEVLAFRTRDGGCTKRRAPEPGIITRYDHRVGQPLKLL